MAVTAADKRRSTEIVKRLRRAYPEAHCALDFKDPLQLLIATILSAQCTDVRVNIVTPVLFKKYPTAAALAAAERTDVEQIIQSTGFFRSKAKSIQGCCTKLVAEHGGQVPQTMEELVKLPGVGRKTANVVLGTAYGVAAGVVVDTHVGRISHRLGLTTKNDAVKIELDLMAQIPQRSWIAFSHEMIFHGRAICIARRPKCEICPLEPVCPRIGVEERGQRPKARKVASGK
ncbi:MAG TPA: endonuclease III [Pirellulales bacterium]|nr:endonuclease III [Pirellulales bacterium]